MRGKKRLLALLCIVVLLIAMGAMWFFYYFLPLETYNNAKSLEEHFNIYSAIDSYNEVAGFKDSKKNIERLANYLFDDNYHIQYDLTARIDEGGKVKWKYVDEDEDAYKRFEKDLEDWNDIKDIAFLGFADYRGSFGQSFFGLLNTGKVIHTPLQDSYEKQAGFDTNSVFIRNVEKEFLDTEWQNIEKISNSLSHIVGLKYDGTVVSAGDNSRGQCDTDAWTDIVDIAAGGGFTVGLKSDGTVVMAVQDFENRFVWREGEGKISKTSANEETKLLEPVYTWKNIIKICADSNHVVGLTDKGKVVAAGQNRYGQLCVEEWDNIKDIYATEMTTFALGKDEEIYFTKYIEQSM